MPNPLSLNERYQNILRATIQHYIATAEPVGSKTLVEEYKFSVSSATIRNALGQLEKAGLLYQPHVSAGRIPSDSGYRIYVDQLLTLNESISKSIRRSLQTKLQGNLWNFESLLQRATQILAGLSGCIALITFPQTQTIKLRHLQLVLVSDKQVIILLVTDHYQTHSIPMELPASLQSVENTEILDQELQILSNFLNSKLRDKHFAELSHLNWQELDQDFACYTDFLQRLLQHIRPVLRPSDTTPMAIHGVAEMIRQPEFSQLEQVQMLLHLLEQEQEQLFPLIFDAHEGDLSPSAQDATPRFNGDRLNATVTLRIGSENPLESMRPCTLISSLYRQGNRPVGSVNLIGPTRMVYEQVIPLVESTADYLSDALSV